FALTTDMPQYTNGKATILAGPADADLAPALDAAGLVVDSASAAESEGAEPMDEFLSKLVNREKSED
ncbi:hypothetical protein LCGC14_2947190, partial [marine sediment metagenome]